MTRDRRLHEALLAYRIGDPKGEFPIWDDGGARLSSGRWHEAGAAVIYASKHYSTAMLEKLVHYQGEIPAGQHFIEISFRPEDYEVVNGDLVDGDPLLMAKLHENLAATGSSKNAPLS